MLYFRISEWGFFGFNARDSLRIWIGLVLMQSAPWVHAGSTQFQEKVQLLGRPLSIQNSIDLDHPCDDARFALSSAMGEDCARRNPWGTQAEQSSSIEILGKAQELIRFSSETQLEPQEESSFAGEFDSSELGSDGTSFRPKRRRHWASPLGSDSSLGEVEPANGITFTRHDLYIGGTRVWMGRVRWQDGSFRYTGGLPPTQIPVPLFVYPLGPLVMKIEAGVELEGVIEGRLMPGLSIPIRDSTLLLNFSTRLYAAAYLQASAQLLFLRGGVEGRVHVLDLQFGSMTYFYLSGARPRSQVFGFAELLGGTAQGFIDYLFPTSRWKRLYKKSFYDWSGSCFSFVNGVSRC